MDITVNSNIVKINGNIKSISDYQQIKETLDALSATHESIIIEIKDSISITSSIIGYLTKLVQKEGIDLSIKVGNASLMELFDDLNLVSLFNVRRI